MRFISTCCIVQLVSLKHLDCFLAMKHALKEPALRSSTLQKTSMTKTTETFVMSIHTQLVLKLIEYVVRQTILIKDLTINNYTDICTPE